MAAALSANPRKDTLAQSVLKAAGISGDDLRSLAGLFKEVAAGLSAKLGKLTDATIETELRSLDTIDRDEALELAGSDSAVSVVTVESWGSSLVFAADRTFVFSTVDVLFGATGDEPAFTAERPFTAIELNLVDKVFRTLVIALDQAFSGGTSSLFKLAEVVNGARFDRDLMTDTRVTACRIGLKAFGRTGTLTILFPRASYRAMHEALVRLLQEPADRADPEWAKKMRTEVTRARVAVEAYVDHGKMTLEEVGRLAPGQVIRLAPDAFDHVRLRSGGQALFNCALGKTGNTFTVRVKDPVDSEEDFINDITAG
jgi:flagellar motor switch protein FliM